MSLTRRQAEGEAERFDYQVIEEIGAGKFGKVYKAINKTTKETVAIKVLPIAKKTMKTIQHEIELLKGCDCHNVVKFFGTYQTQRSVYIVMEYCSPGSIGTILKALEKLEEPQIAAICYHVLTGLQYLHSAKKIHRDIKGENILLSTGGIAKLADFGVAAQLKHTLDWHQTANGTPYWMAPELALEENYRYSVDIWSLGITVIEMAEKRPPFWEHTPMRALFKIMHMTEPPTLAHPENFSEAMNDFIAKCLVLAPSDRWTATQLLEHPFIQQHKAQAKALVLDLLEEYNRHIYKPIETEHEPKSDSYICFVKKGDSIVQVIKKLPDNADRMQANSKSADNFETKSGEGEDVRTPRNPDVASLLPSPRTKANGVPAWLKKANFNNRPPIVVAGNSNDEDESKQAVEETGEQPHKVCPSPKHSRTRSLTTLMQRMKLSETGMESAEEIEEGIDSYVAGEGEDGEEDEPRKTDTIEIHSVKGE